jgi:hypothetical protein
MDEKSYLSGYTDGEGCFCVTFNRSNRHKFGWDIRPSFSVSQNRDRAEVLELFRQKFKCGTIRPDRSDRTLKYEVRSVNDLFTKVVPHFERYPLLSKKRIDFEMFSQIVRLMHDREHLKTEGFKKVVQASERLNTGGKKKYVRRQIKV